MQIPSFLEALTELVEKEKRSDIDNIMIDDLPLWRLVRQQVRVSYFKKHNLFVNNTSNRKIPVADILINTLTSTLDITKLLIFNKKVDNIFFTFGRIIKLDDAYLCKFTDPIIETNHLGSSSIVFEKPLYGSHRKPRHYSDRVYYTDFIDYTSIVLAYVIAPVMYLKYNDKYHKLNNMIRQVYNDYNFGSFKICLSHSSFLINSTFYKIILKSIDNPKRIFTVNREIFKPAIYVANKNSITTYELQHGVTESETILYSGVYNEEVDTNYFLSFTDVSENNYFGVPSEKLINIGFAYKSLIADKIGSSTPSESSLKILCISTPNNTNNVVNILINTAKRYPKHSFLLRLHPQEGLTSTQEILIKKVNNIDIDDNTYESMLRCAEHDKIMGAYSSVLYEAASLNKPVAVFDFNSLESLQTELMKLTTPSDIDNFLSKNSEPQRIKKTMHSDFNHKLFKKDILND